MTKHTYIFKVEDEHMSQHRLQKLMMALERAKIVSWKYTGECGCYTSVQVFTDEYRMHEVFTKSGIWLDTREAAIKQARLNGDSSVSEAAKRLNALRKSAAKQTEAQRKALEDYIEKASLVPVPIEVRVKQLRAAGCDVTVERMSTDEFEVKVFGESFVIVNGAHVFEFLRGLEKGFTLSSRAGCVATKRSKRSA